MKMRGCRKEATGGESRGQNYYIFCPKARTAPFAELRDRDSTLIAAAECRTRIAGSFVTFD